MFGLWAGVIEDVKGDADAAGDPLQGFPELFNPEFKMMNYLSKSQTIHLVSQIRMVLGQQQTNHCCYLKHDIKLNELNI